jgi:hypothetical protein
MLNKRSDMKIGIRFERIPIFFNVKMEAHARYWPVQ